MRGDAGIGTASVAPVTTAGLPPLRLLRLHRHSLVNVLVMGGEAGERERIARAFHRESPLRTGPFVRLDCALEEDRLCAALQRWMTGASDSSDSSLMVAERGTLYLDHVDSLSPETQRLLLAFVTRFANAATWNDAAAWGGRLVCGSEHHLGDLADQGTFLDPLYDCLDKARIELEPSWHGGAA